MADDLIDRLEADACALSRVIGDVLILVAERVPDGTTLLQGQGYLISEFRRRRFSARTGSGRS